MKTIQVLICSSGGEEIVPGKVRESRLPDNSVIHYGQLRPYTHSGQDCEWSHLVQPLIEHEEVFPSVYI